MTNNFFLCVLLLLAVNCQAKSDVYVLILATLNLEKNTLLDLKDTYNLSKDWNFLKSDECVNLRPNLGLVVAYKNKDKLKVEVERKKYLSEIPDAYIRKCQLERNSLFGFGFDYVDKQIFKISNADLVDYSIQEVSSLVLLSNASATIISRTLPNFEGPGALKNSLVVLNSVGRNELMHEDCFRPSNIQLNENLVLFQCSVGSAGVDPIYGTFLYNLDSKSLSKPIKYCHKGKFYEDGNPYCIKQVFKNDGTGYVDGKRVEMPI